MIAAILFISFAVLLVVGAPIAVKRFVRLQLGA